MHILSDTGTTLTLVTGSAVSTDYVIDYVDHATTSFSPLSGRGNVATATTTTIVSAPAANTTRQVKSIKITNRHASSAQTVQVFVVESAVSYALSENIALAAGQCVLLNDKGWTIMSDQDQVVVATGKLLTVNNAITLAGTDGTTMTFPATSATIARVDAANTFTGNQTFSDRVLVDDVTDATTTTDGSLQTDGGLSVAKSAIIGNHVKIVTAGYGIFIKEGSNARMGTATLSSGTATVSTTAVSEASRIFLTIQSLGTVTSPKSVAVTAREAGTSFTITSSDATDTSVVAWMIVDPA